MRCSVKPKWRPNHRVFNILERFPSRITCDLGGQGFMRTKLGPKWFNISASIYGTEKNCHQADLCSLSRFVVGSSLTGGGKKETGLPKCEFLPSSETRPGFVARQFRF